MNDPVARCSGSGRFPDWLAISSSKGRKPSTGPPTQNRFASGVTQPPSALAASFPKRSCTMNALVSASLTM